MKRKKFKIDKEYLFEAMQNKKVYSFAQLENKIGEYNGTISRLGRANKTDSHYVCSRQKRDKIYDGLLGLDFKNNELDKIFFEVD